MATLPQIFDFEGKSIAFNELINQLIINLNEVILVPKDNRDHANSFRPERLEIPERKEFIITSVIFHLEFRIGDKQ